jgi:pre-rRNA-processing protein TSR3
MIYDYHQDDPKKCTSARLQEFRLARPLHSLRQIPADAIVLNPASNQTLSFQDRSLLLQNGLVGLDCSWNLAETTFEANLRGENRRLPTLLAGNPTNYSARGKLSTAEAIAAALLITGFDAEARKILKIFKWGETFLSLNKDPLSEYSLTPRDQMFERERDYFPLV